MKKLCVLVASGPALASPAAVQVQAGFRPGYIVRPAGDTVRGEVDYRDARFNARQCHLRAPAALAPTELLAYGLRDGGQLRQYWALVPPTAPPPVGGAAPAPAFLEVLVDGPACRYYPRDAERANYYYVATSTFPLTCNQCQAPAGRVLRAAPAPASAPRQRAQIGLVLGGQLTGLHIEYGTLYHGADKVLFGPKAAVVAGLAFTVPLTALSRKLALEAELLYAAEFYDQSSAVGSYGNTLRCTFDFAHLRLPLLVHYTFPKGAVRPFMEAGPALTYALKQENTLQLTDTQGKTSPPGATARA